MSERCPNGHWDSGAKRCAKYIAKYKVMGMKGFAFKVYELKGEKRKSYYKVTSVHNGSGEYRHGYTSSPTAMMREIAKPYKIKKLRGK